MSATIYQLQHIRREPDGPWVTSDTHGSDLFVDVDVAKRILEQRIREHAKESRSWDDADDYVFEDELIWKEERVFWGPAHSPSVRAKYDAELFSDVRWLVHYCTTGGTMLEGMSLNPRKLLDADDIQTDVQKEKA